MRRFIYLDTDTLNSYIAQIYDGLVQVHETETQSSVTKDTHNKADIKGQGGLEIGLLGKGLKGDIGINYEHNKGNTESEIIGDLQKKILHDNAFDQLITYLKDKQLFAGNEVGDFIQIEDTFYIMDWAYYKKLFDNEKFLSFVIDNEIKEKKEELDRYCEIEISNSNNDSKEIKKKYNKEKYETENIIKQNYRDIKEIIEIMESVIPYSRTLCISNNLVILNEEYMRDEIEMTAFKYGGKIKVVGYITNIIGDESIAEGLPDFAQIGYMMNEVMLSLFNNKRSLNIVHPIAIYYE